jgi:hypothetical protein
MISNNTYKGTVQSTVNINKYEEIDTWENGENGRKNWGQNWTIS